MFKRKAKLLSILCASSVLSGCWDQEPLREARLAYSIGSDITEENQLQQTIELVKVQAESNLHSRMKYIQQRVIT
ncbi:spore germination protein KC [Bacillus shihchuchen]|uniref:Spore germination protein KC n=1 Tax=Bacillus shihchuchen TaxID=3036942 RepID=A0ABT7KXZ8_9BACI|nr:spore germination protein KC [Bacillus shihchuchen]